MKKLPLVSIVMPAYNAEKYIESAIDSVLKQTYKNLELIIIDDGSTDSTKSIVRKYIKIDSRVRLISNEKNIGISKTLNKGIKFSKGKYFARLDSDDISDLHRIDTQVRYLENNPDTSICGTWATAIDESGRVLSTMKSPTGIILKFNYWKPSPFISSSVMVRKKILDVYHFDENFVTAEDYDLWIRILKNYRGHNIPVPLVRYRVHSEGISKRLKRNCVDTSLKSFTRNFGIRDLSMEQFLSLSSLRFKMSSLKRFRKLTSFRKELKLPLWFAVIDSIYYAIRKTIFSIFPNTIPNK